MLIQLNPYLPPQRLSNSAQRLQRHVAVRRMEDPIQLLAARCQLGGEGSFREALRFHLLADLTCNHALRGDQAGVFEDALFLEKVAE